MISVQEDTGFKRIEEYGFAEWLKEVQEVIQSGYEFDFESNANYPLQIGTVYTAVLKPKVALGDTVQGKLAITVDTTEVKALINEKIAEVKALQAQSDVVAEVPSVQSKVDGRKKK